MARFSKIEIHFEEDGKKRVAVIRPQGIVQAVFLEGAEKDIKSFANLKPQKVKTAPQGVQLEPAGPSGGPGEVCYLVNGVLECWDPDT